MTKEPTACPTCGKPVKGARGLRAHAKYCEGAKAEEQPKPKAAKRPKKSARDRRTAEHFAHPFQGIPSKPPIKWPLFELWSSDVAAGDRFLAPLFGRIEALLGRRIRARVHASGPFIELQIADDPAEVQGLQSTVMWLVDHLCAGGQPFGAMAVQCGRLFIAPPVPSAKGVLWGHILIEGEQSKINPWRGTSWS